MRLLAWPSLALALASCGSTTPTCTPSSCASGCCDERGECSAGTSLLACGGGGAACAVCALNEVCTAERQCGRIDGGVYDASFPYEPDASVNLDAGTYRPDGGPTGGDGGTVDAGPVSYAQNIVPIFERCSGCHAWSHASTVGRPAPAGRSCGGFGQLIVASDVPASLLYLKISGAPPCGSAMPQGGDPLPPGDVATVRRWIEEGARNN